MRAGLRGRGMLGMLAVIAACGLVPTGVDPVEVSTRVTPSRVAAGDSVEVVAVFHNTTDRPVTLTFGTPCLFYVIILEKDSREPIPFDGRDGCIDVVAHFEVAGRDSLVAHDWIIAQVNAEPVAAGEYIARLEFTGVSEDREVELLVQ